MNRAIAATICLFALVVGLGCESNSQVPRPLDKGSFHLAIPETLEGEVTDINVTELFLTRRLLYMGYQRVEEAAKADILITGSVDCTYYQDHKFHFYDHSVHLEHQFKALVKCTVVDTRKPADAEDRKEILDFPEPLIYGRDKMEDARLDIRRDAGTLLAKHVFHGKIFGDARVVALVDAVGDYRDVRPIHVLIHEFVKCGHDAVPYLLEMLDDDRKVDRAGDYPGMDDSNRELLSYPHIADAALRQILGRDSGLGIDSTSDYIQDVQKAWTWAWEDLQQVPQKYRILTKERQNTRKAAQWGTYQENEAITGDE
ncbi:MAG: hypothetical protein AAF581_14340 [Planctomycetota bacterium]